MFKSAQKINIYQPHPSWGQGVNILYFLARSCMKYKNLQKETHVRLVYKQIIFFFVEIAKNNQICTENLCLPTATFIGWRVGSIYKENCFC